ncbi:MAG: hypothetical protein MUC91_02020 [Verrucomicrobia bacterium]|jgi:hypothetical protein|nr:hypothetical protein [Verrucomicrobiota bacterium]
MPPQVVRLVLLTIGIVGSYLIARYFLTPASFNEYGHYRGAALMEIASHPVVFAGKKSCEDCHFDEFERLGRFEHKTLSCEGCHGAGQAHTENPDIRLAILNFSHCARCHEANPSRPSWHKQIDLRDHYAGEACTECHVAHAPSQVPESPEAP